MKNLYSRLILLFALALPMQHGWAQGVTTSSLTGTISDPQGSGLPGATVVAVHTPTGTQYGTAANVDGRFTIPNMRIGGPYRVTVTFIGFQPQQIEDITLKLAEPFVLNVRLTDGGTQLSEVVVSAPNTRSVLNADRNGAITNISNQEIMALPTISRSLNDFTRLTPQANGAAIGGGNYRQNFITVDGADFNNNFGIGANLPAGGSPISLDAIEEISVNVTPYDIRQSGFIGSAINAVTRSGTNEFSGSAYTFMRNQKMQGTRVGDRELPPMQDMQFNQHGFRLGGPIIRNKLFFFLNAETEAQTRPGQQRIAATPSTPFGSAPNVSRPTATELDGISNYLRQTYGYETGPYQDYDFANEQTKLMARLDWNINPANRLNVRYSQVESKNPVFVSGSRSPFTGFASGAGRTNINALHFRNSNYFQEANFYSLAAELNSTFGGIFANTLRGTYTNQNDPRSSESQIFPFVDILRDGQPFTSFGYEPFTYGNLRDVQMYSVVNNLTFELGKHNFTVGGQADFSTTKNGFQRFGTSYYTFASWEDFTGGRNPTDFGITYSLRPGFEQAFPSFQFNQYSLYAQDEFRVTDNLRVTGGIRVDLPTYPEPLDEHPLISNLTFEGGRKINTASLPQSTLMWSPRLGFNWDVLGNRSLQVRGGSGVFTGRVPFVWIVAQAGDAGMLQITEQLSGSQVPGPFNPDPAAYRPDSPPVAGTVIPGTITAISPTFRMPQTWKTSLAVDGQLPFGIVGTLEGIYNHDLNTALFRHVNLANPQPLAAPGYPDNRMIYPNANTNRFLNPLVRGQAVAPGTTGAGAFNTVVLDNASQGYYWSVTAKLDKQFSNGFFASLAYTRSEAQNLYDGGGDQPLGAWQNTPTVNGSNFHSLAHAAYVVPDRVVASLSYRKEYLRHLGTSFSFFYQASVDGRFSYTYAGDINRDGGNADLMYVPKDPSEITFVPLTIGSGATARTYSAQEQSDMFFAYISQDKYLSTRRGQYAERNAASLPWRHQVDFRLLQDVFMNVGGKRNTLQLSWDVFNFGNLLNAKWGTMKMVKAPSLLVPTNTAALMPGGTTAANATAPRPTFRLAQFAGAPVQTTFEDNLSLSSTYYMQVGLRYTFN